MSRYAAAAALAITLVTSAVVYLTNLSEVPAYLMQDEVNFSLQAHAIATTARDTNGRLWPVYFSETGFEAGRDPVMIYWTAMFLAFVPLTDASARFPTALLALVSIALTFGLARQWRHSEMIGVVAALCLALTPGFYTNARLALSITYAIPVVVAWLICLQRALAGGGRWWSLAAGASLGLGIYTYLASMILMPMLMVVSVVVLLRAQQQRSTAYLAAGFAVLLLPLAFWLMLHPDRFSNLLAVYRPASVASSVGWRDRLTAYWMFFNPDYLFISGDGRITNSTRAAGLFPIAFALLLPIGIYRLWRGDGGALGGAVLAGLLLSPLPTAASGHLEINRVLTIIPFGVLVASVAVGYLWSSTTLGKVLAAGLVCGSVVQFAGFHRHYLETYRITSAAWFGGNNRGAIEAVLERMTSTTPALYLDRGTPIERYWQFYTVVHGRKDLANWPTYFDGARFDFNAAPGSLLICEAADAACQPMAQDARWRVVALARQPDGVLSHSVYVRNP